MTSKVDSIETLIVGAGVIGSSVAMHLARMGAERIRVIDFDLEGTFSSSELNAGGVRATWNQPINIQMSKATIDYFATIADEIGYRACGYLWLHPEDRLQVALKARDRQQALGWEAQVWDVPQLKRQIPFLDKTDGIAGAVFAPRDGLVNPNLLKNHFRSEAKRRGVVFDDRCVLRQAEYGPRGASGSGIQVTVEQLKSFPSPDAKLQALTDGELSSSVERIQHDDGVRKLKVQRIVNCAGPWALNVARVLGYHSPCFPVRRQISIFDCRDVDLTPYGMVVDTSGVYFHPEATNGLAGFASHDERPGVNFDYQGEAFFNERIWPALYERSSAFEKLKHLTGWAGLYEVSPDETAVLGAVENGNAGHSGRVFEAHSFSGHGVMHSYAAGLGLAEKIVLGRFATLDLSGLASKRFETGELIRENLVI